MRRLPKAITLSAMVAAALAISCQKSEPAPKPAPADGGEWRIETVAADVGRSSAIALDSEGLPHIAYKSNVDGSIGARGLPKYASRAGGEWESVTLDANPDHHGWCHSIFIDGRDRVYIFYYYDSIRYARWTGSAWETGTVDTPEDVSGYKGIAFDSRGRTHISDCWGRDLKYARATGDGWELETVESGKWSPNSSIALDRFGHPHILYAPTAFGWDTKYKPVPRLKYAYWTGTAWDDQTVDAKGDTYSGQAVAVDTRGRTHIAYQDTLRRDLKYGVLVDGRWRIETVDAEGLVGTGAAIVLDAQDLPYISYYGENGLKFAHYTGDGWYVKTLDAEAGKPVCGDWETALVLDARDRPHISYFDRCKDELKYATWTGSEWKAQPPRGPEEVKDSSAAGALVRWYPGLSLLEPGEPWRPVLSFYCRGVLYDKPFTDDTGYDVIEEEVEEVGSLDKATEVEVTDAKSVYTLFWPAGIDPSGEKYSYYTWLRVRAKGTEGWGLLRGVHPDFIGPYESTGPLPVALARFAKPFSPLREGPSPTFPVIKEDRYFDSYYYKESAAAGEVEEVVARFGDWLCISPGWLPADTPGLAFYYLTFVWRPYRGLEEVYFYFPVAADVDRVIYSIDLNDLRRESPLPNEDPVMTLAAEGRAYGLGIDYLDVLNNSTYSRRYFEAVLPRPVKREDIESATFTVGTEPHRVKATFDPREAWGEGAKK